MARSNVKIGPNLLRGYGGTENAPVPIAIVDSGVSSGNHVSSNTTAKRLRPKNLLANQTNYSAMETQTMRQNVSLPYGNFEPISTYVSTQNSQATVSAQALIADSRAVMNLREAIKDLKWDVLVFSAELHKLLQFVLETIQHLIQAYRHARRGDILGLAELYHKYDYKGKRRKPPYKRVGNVWMQWRYAVRPAVKDMEDAMTEFALSKVRPRVIRADGRATEYVDKELTNTRHQFGQVTARRGGFVKVKYVIYYTTSTAQSFTRLGLTNLGSLLWELTPFSFVVDNVIPIGRYIAGLDAAFGVTVVGGFRVETHDWGEYGQFRNAQAFAKIKSYSRSPITQIPSQPPPRWKAPSGDIPSKVLDALVLLAQQADRGRR